jgi:hypothetical protein
METLTLRPLAPGVIERLSFSTSVDTSRNSTEARHRVRVLPRYTYRWTTAATDGLGNRAWLATLRGAARADAWVVPLWAHMRLGALPDRGLAVGATHALAIAPGWNQAGFVLADGLPDGTEYTAPIATGKIIESTPIAHPTPNVAAGITLGVLLDPYQESIAAYSGATGTDGKPRPTLPISGADGLTETLEDTANLLDYGQLWARDYLYRKQTIGLQLQLHGRAAIKANREFLFYCAGRLNAFWWQAPSEALALWRLDHDDIEITYLTPDLATLPLTLAKTTQ